MDDGVGARQVHEAGDAVRIADIQLDEAAAWTSQRVGQIGLLDGPGIERVEVVDRKHLGAVGKQPIDQVRPDEPGSAGHDDSHDTSSKRGSRSRTAPALLLPAFRRGANRTGASKRRLRGSSNC
jgi:hypothetical protein